jgi:hypothetical protein
MSDQAPHDYIIVFPDGDEARLHHDLQPGQQEQETLIEVDPLIQEFLRAPYDPVIGAAAMGRLTGEAVRRPPASGWMRLLAWLVAIALLAGAFVVLLVDPPVLSLAQSPEQALPAYLQPLAIEGALAVAGVLLMWRLIRR